MSEHQARSRPQGKSLFWPTYMFTWALLAAGSLTYLSLGNLQAIGIDGFSATPPRSTPESNRAELDRAQLVAKVRSLNETVASLHTELAKLKHEQQQKANEEFVARRAFAAPPPGEKGTAESVSEITTSALAKPEPETAQPTAAGDSAPTSVTPEPTPAGAAIANDNNTIATTAPPSQPEAQPVQSEVLNSNTPTVAAASPPPAAAPTPAVPVAAKKPRRKRNLATSPLRPGRLPPLPPFNTRIASNGHATSGRTQGAPSPNPSQRAANGIRTSSLPVPTDLEQQPATPTVAAPSTRPLPFGTPMVKRRTAAASPAALSLSTAQSVTGLRASWLLLTTRYPGIFAGFQPRYVADEARGTFRLVAGPVAGHAEADRICSELRAQSVTCGVTSFVGNALR